MTAETDLLPLPPLHIAPSVEPVDYPDVAQALMDYARANVARAVAPLQAEIEALRAEVERVNSWNARVSVCRDHVADIVDGPCVICALDAAEARAERLEEALREAATPPDQILLDAIEREIRQLEGKDGWLPQATRIANLRAAIDQACGKGEQGVA